ncbi:MAG: lysophospholipid acyltransferase family protein [Polyangiaceae bacterium]
MRQVLEHTDLLQAGDEYFRPVERRHVRLVRASLDNDRFDHAMRWCQRTIGARWINGATSNLRTVVGLDRLPPLSPDESFICVSNHRSFFDMYVITSLLVGRGMPHRLLFPVRSNFFYDNPLGMVVNGAMSFFAMYPPIFREPKRAALNLLGLDEVARVLQRGGVFVGLHPEGTRGKGDDPFELLPAQSGVGRIIHKARVRVLPVFVTGLVNSIPEQVIGNARGTGKPVVMAFGAPVELDDVYARPGSPRAYKETSSRCLEAIRVLGEEARTVLASSAR